MGRQSPYHGAILPNARARDRPVHADDGRRHPNEATSSFGMSAASPQLGLNLAEGVFTDACPWIMVYPVRTC
jgi:hypothetical protein